MYPIIALFVLTLVVLLSIFYYVRKSSINQKKEYDTLAKEFGLKLQVNKSSTISTFCLVGQRNNYDFSICETSQGIGEARFTMTSITYAKTPFNFEFALKLNKLAQHMSRLLTKKHKSNATLQHRYSVTTNNEELLSNLLNSGFSKLINDNKSLIKGEIINHNSQFSYHQYGSLKATRDFNHIKKVILILDQLIDFQTP